MLSRFCFPAGFSPYLFYKGSVLALKSRFHLDYFLNYKSTRPLSHILKISHSLTLTCDLNFFYFSVRQKSVIKLSKPAKSHFADHTSYHTSIFANHTWEVCLQVWFFESHFYHTFKVWSHVWSHIYFCMGNDEDIQGSFYEPELLKAKQDVFCIDKVIRRDYKKKQALVKWKGYSDDFNSWIPMKDLTAL